MGFITLLEKGKKEGLVTSSLAKELKNFYLSYMEAVKVNGASQEEANLLMVRYLSLVFDQIKKPFSFSSYHEKVSYLDYQFGLDFVRNIVIKESSSIVNKDVIFKIEEQIAKGENVILLANHQTEVDPQAICLMLESEYSKLAESMIFIAGQRVITDPFAVPISKGCNLLCVYSKRYIDDHPESRAERLAYNQSTMKKMNQLLSEGGKCIYVAPSGGRDRPNKEGIVEVAQFDSQSIEMFYLMAQHAEKTTHFYPLALSTFALLPPPNKIKKSLGEPRRPKATSIHLAFGEEIEMENLFDPSKKFDKKQKRILRSESIWKKVSLEYDQIKKT